MENETNTGVYVLIIIFLVLIIADLLISLNTCSYYHVYGGNLSMWYEGAYYNLFIK